MARIVNFHLDYQRLLTLAATAPNLAQETMELALLKSCRLVQSVARAKHRFRTKKGCLEKSVEFTVIPGTLEGIIQLNESVAPYAAWVHDGTRPHLIVPKAKRALRWSGSAGFIFAKRVHHPGTKKDQFLYEAGTRSVPQIEVIFSRALDDLAAQIGGM